MGKWWRENIENKLVEWKTLVDTAGIKIADNGINERFSYN